MRNVIKVLLISMISLVSVAASASTIVGTLTMGGVYQAPVGEDLSTMTEFNLDSVWANNTPAFDPTIDGFTAASGTGLSLSSFAPVTGFFTVGDWIFDLESLSIDKQLANKLVLSGSGLLYKAIDDKHAVDWSFSSEALGSYSMTVTAVPVPAAVWLFGSGLIGLVGVARRKA